MPSAGLAAGLPAPDTSAPSHQSLPAAASRDRQTSGALAVIDDVGLVGDIDILVKPAQRRHNQTHQRQHQPHQPARQGRDARLNAGLGAYQLHKPSQRHRPIFGWFQIVKTAGSALLVVWHGA